MAATGTERGARALLSVALSVLVTWPMARAPRAVLLGDGDADVWNHAWGPWWWAHSLGLGGLPWRTGLLRAPEGGVLWFIDPLLAGIGAPLVGPLGVAGAYNLVILLSVALAAAGGMRLARALGARAGAPVAGAALAVGAPLLSALHNGISEASWLGGVAFALALSEEAAVAGTTRAWLKAGAALGLLTGLSPYLGLGSCLAVACRVYLAVLYGRRWRLEGLRAPAPGAALSVLLAAPFLLALRAQLQATDAIVRRPGAMDEALALTHALDPRALLLNRPTWTDTGFVHAERLGWVMLALALISRRRGWTLAIGLSLLLALGPWLSWDKQWVTFGQTRIPLPFRAIQLLAPDLAITHARRLMLPALALLAGLAALGAERLARGRGWVVAALSAAVLAEGLLLGGVPWPLPTSDAQIPGIYAGLAQDDSVVLDLPTDAGDSMATSRYLYWQTAHGHPIPYAPDARASTASLMDEPAFQVLAALCARRADEQINLGLNQAPPAEALRPERLRGRGVRYIMLHRSIDPERFPALAEALEAALGPGQVYGDDLRWDLGSQTDNR